MANDDWIDHALSPPRFAPYVAASGGDRANALHLYWWNAAAGAAFYPLLQAVEVALRNAVHRQLGEQFGRADWWTVAPLRSKEERAVRRVHEKLSTGGRPASADDIVAGSSLGFWVSLLSRTYHRALWVPGLHRTFRHYPGSRRSLHGDLETIRLFRNRIMHHEPIHHRHLAADHETILRVLNFLSPEKAAHLKNWDRVHEVLGQRPELPGQQRGERR